MQTQSESMISSYLHALMWEANIERCVLKLKKKTVAMATILTFLIKQKKNKFFLLRIGESHCYERTFMTDRQTYGHLHALVWEANIERYVLKLKKKNGCHGNNSGFFNKTKKNFFFA